MIFKYYKPADVWQQAKIQNSNVIGSLELFSRCIFSAPTTKFPGWDWPDKASDNTVGTHTRGVTLVSQCWSMLVFNHKVAPIVVCFSEKLLKSFHTVVGIKKNWWCLRRQNSELGMISHLSSKHSVCKSVIAVSIVSLHLRMTARFTIIKTTYIDVDAAQNF